MINKTIGVVLARSGSKGIKNKNIKIIEDRPLINYSLDALIKSKTCKRIIVSTDSAMYKKLLISNYRNKIDIFNRSKKFAKDSSSSEESLLEIFNSNLNISESFQKCIFFQLTSPLIKPIDFQKGLEVFKKKKYDSLFTGYASKKFYWQKNKSKYLSLNYDFKNRPRRQNFEGNIVENGAFYIFDIKNFKKYKNRLFGNIGCYLMPENRSLEIDGSEDIKLFRYYLNHKN